MVPVAVPVAATPVARLICTCKNGIDSNCDKKKYCLKVLVPLIYQSSISEEAVKIWNDVCGVERQTYKSREAYNIRKV